MNERDDDPESLTEAMMRHTDAEGARAGEMLGRWLALHTGHRAAWKRHIRPRLDAINAPPPEVAAPPPEIVKAATPASYDPQTVRVRIGRHTIIPKRR